MPKIEELRALLAKATKGPWHADDDGTIWWSDGSGDYDVANRERIAKDDARLMAAAVNALPALLDVLHAARVAVQFGRVLSASIKQEYDRDPDVGRFDQVADDFDAALAKLETT